MSNVWSPTFVIGTIHIGQIEGASCLNLGNNWVSDFSSYQRVNQGFGTVHGDHALIRANRSLVHDPDTIDLPETSDPDWRNWLRRLAPTAHGSPSGGRLEGGR